MANGVITYKSNFEKLLRWLDEDREQAGYIYETIRVRLIKIFYSRGCQQAEEMTDETIDRVVRKIDWLTENYQGEPALFFYGVAKKVLLEYSKKSREIQLPPNLTNSHSDPNELELLDRCLGKCLKKLPADERSFIISYYNKNKQEKIDQRKQMTADMNISPETLRVRAYRIRVKLQKCLFNCLDKNSLKRFD